MQKITMAIPTYWSPPEGTDLREDRVFDHPIPLDQEGTLGRALESLCVLNRSDFSVVLIVASTLDSIENEVIRRVEEICKPFNGKIDISLVHQGNLKNLKEKLLNNNVPLDAYALINLDNYSSVRNMCSLAGDRYGMEQCNINEEIVKSESFKDIDTRKWLLELRSNWKVLTNAAAGIGIPE